MEEPKQPMTKEIDKWISIAMYHLARGEEDLKDNALDIVDAMLQYENRLLKHGKKSVNALKNHMPCLDTNK